MMRMIVYQITVGKSRRLEKKYKRLEFLLLSSYRMMQKKKKKKIKVLFFSSLIKNEPNLLVEPKLFFFFTLLSICRSIPNFETKLRMCISKSLPTDLSSFDDWQ